MLSEKEIIAILEEAEVLLKGHFLLTSGKHSNRYLQCAKVFRNTKYSEKLCGELAEKFADCGVDVVIGPAMGAVQMAYEVSRQLGCENFFAEREEGKMVLRRGFEIKPNMKCLLVEDVVTTGGSVKEVLELVQSMGGIVVGIGSIVDRSGGNASFSVPFKSVIRVDVETWEKEECPLCKEGNTSAIKPGSRKIN